MPEETRSPVSASIERLREDLDHLLGAAWSNGERALDAFGFKSDKSWTPPVDIVESEQQVFVYVSLPGVEPSAIDLRLAGNMLTFEGKIDPVPTNERDIRHKAERHAGPFSRSIPLPVPVAADQVSAEFRAGVLKVTLGKQEIVKPRHIQVVSGSESTAPVSTGTTPACPPAEGSIPVSNPPE